MSDTTTRSTDATNLQGLVGPNAGPAFQKAREHAMCEVLTQWEDSHSVSADVLMRRIRESCRKALGKDEKNE